jgi:hypothetical protein
MRQLKLLGVALTVIFALTAVAVTTAAFAEQPEILSTLPAKFTGSGGTGKLEFTKGKKIECKTLTGSGEFTSVNLGIGTIDFHECIGESTSVECHSLGDKEGLILFGGDIHIVDLGGTSLPLGIVVILLSELHVECTGGILFLVKSDNGLIGEVTGITSGVKAKTAKVKFESTAGTQKIKTCTQEKTFCEGKEFLLLGNVGKGFELVGVTGEGQITFEKEGIVDF